MFDWISSRLKKTDSEAHPLASEGGLRSLLDEITAGVPQSILRALSEHFEDLLALEEEISPQARIEATQQLDHHASAALAQAWELLFPDGDQSFLADDIWLTLATYYRHCADACNKALAVFPVESLELSAGRQQFAQLTLRAIQARHGHEKLQRLRYRNGDAALWQNYLDLYRQAQKQGVSAAPLKLADGRSITIQSALLQALMFEVAPLENISPEQIECVDRLLTRDASMLLLRSSLDARSPFVFAGSPPQRFSADRPVPTEALFFGPGLAYNDLLRTLSALEQDKAVDWLAQAPGTLAQKIGLLRLLRTTWSDLPPQRQFQRQESAGLLKVVHGYSQVRRMVAVAAFARSGRQLALYSSYNSRAQYLDEYFGSVAEAVEEEVSAEPLTPAEVLRHLELAGDRDQMEEWRIADSSNQGLGLVVPQQKRWLKIGALLGYRAADSEQWDIAVIRRLGRSKQGHRVAGLQLLSGLALPVSLRPLKEDEAIRGGRDSLADFRDGILLSREDRTLILQADLGQINDRLLLLADGLRQAIRIEEVMESRDDFKLLRYRPELD